MDNVIDIVAFVELTSKKKTVFCMSNNINYKRLKSKLFAIFQFFRWEDKLYLDVFDSTLKLFVSKTPTTPTEQKKI